MRIGRVAIDWTRASIPTSTTTTTTASIMGSDNRFRFSCEEISIWAVAVVVVVVVVYVVTAAVVVVVVTSNFLSKGGVNLHR